MKSTLTWLATTSLFLLTPSVVEAQFCANTCPPLNFGTPVPSLCEGDNAGDSIDVWKEYAICHPTPGKTFSFDSLVAENAAKVIVLANFYIGCNAGRRESGVYAHVAQKYYQKHGNQTIFLTSLKGGTTCNQWANLYQKDAVSLFPDSGIVPKEMPLSVLDQEYELRDDFFTTPFGHPSYVVMDSSLTIRAKFIGPCCGYERYRDCTADIATSLDTTLSEILDEIMLADSVSTENEETPAEEPTTQEEEPFIEEPVVDTPDSGEPECIPAEYSEWSDCSVTCGDTAGIQFRWKNSNACDEDAPVETRSCFPAECADTPACIPELGNSSPEIDTVASGFDGARDVALHPTPGLHLGGYAEGRSFSPSTGEEAWVLNAYNHSVSIVASLGIPEHQTTISRRDRGYYHYMANATALAFNSVGDSSRSADRDSFNYFAVCNDNLNTYLDTKEPNNFMGPTLYNTLPEDRNIVNRLGEECSGDEECFFLHSDMLHEAPACVGIAHDPETTTSYGTVYWAFDSTGNGFTGQLVRFDFQQPHGPGSMDHSVAAVRRYPQVELARGEAGVHAGMVVTRTGRQVFIAVPGANHILVVGADSGTYARTAREEYPIFSNQLPSFEYSIFECPEQRIFASSIEMPTGMAISGDEERLFVAERGSGDILVYEISSGAMLSRIATGFKTIGGLTMSSKTNVLYFVDEETNTLNAVKATSECTTAYTSRLSTTFTAAVEQAVSVLGSDTFSLDRDYSCVADPIIPDAAFFDQVHDDSGYASSDSNVQSNMTGMDAAAALLENRTDCGPTSDLNFDALLLGGYFCHTCLPGNDGAVCDAGGSCSNVQWLGYICDNEFLVIESETGLELQTPDKTVVEDLDLRPDVTYRFSIKGDSPVCIHSSDGQPLVLPGNDSGCAQRGPLLVPVTDEFPSSILLKSRDQTLELTVGGSTGVDAAALTSDKSGGPNVGAIVGPILAGLVVVGVAIFLYYNRQRRDATTTTNKERDSPPGTDGELIMKKGDDELIMKGDGEPIFDVKEQPQEVSFQETDVEVSFSGTTQE